MYDPSLDEKILNCDINDYFDIELMKGKNIDSIDFEKLYCLDKYKIDNDGNLIMVKFKNKVHAIKRLVTYYLQ